MASRTFALALAFTLLTVAAADAKAKRAPVAPMDIIWGTTDLIYDVYGLAFNAVADASTKHGVSAKANELLTTALAKDPIGLACSKIGCKKNDIMERWKNMQAAALQGKAQVWEQAAKVSDALDKVAVTVVTKFETLAPSYKGLIAMTFGNLVLFALYSLFVTYVVFKVMLFAIKTALSIFCCVCCCGCCRRGQAATKKSKGGKTGYGQKSSPDAKATPTKNAAKAKAKK